MLLSIDVGFANLGWVVFHRGDVIDMGVITTQKAKRKTVRVADDNADRAIVLARGLAEVMRRHRIKGIIGEMPSGGSQSSRASNQMGIATGVVSAIVGVWNVPCEWCIPTDVKKAVTGKRSASKDEVMDGVAAKMGWRRVTSGRSVEYVSAYGSFNKGRFEHVADAIGAYWALGNDNLVKMFG